MAAAGKGGGEPDLHQVEGHPLAEHPLAEAEHVGVVMLPAHAGRIGVVAQGGADGRLAVGHHRHADARAADEDAPVARTRGHRPADGAGKLRIVHRRTRVRAHVLHLIPLLPQAGDNGRLEPEAAMIAPHGHAKRTALPFRARPAHDSASS